ncbi:tyrosine-type recombinase/integrase [Ketobacter sp.]|uniref:tyrosine-type recombinase/integrase n=1 Tax=Ketobacter sp. TaxID=2083498 RepID=UPI000F1124F0|nr:site-specific integrase [Ketobacter sp.]RLU00598.1 MAG: site-specific integrase [Ketobacter sp.]
MATIRERTTSKGETRYQAIVRLKGFPPQTATFNRKTDAKRWVTNTEAAIREGRHFKTTESKKHTLSDLIERYIKYVLPAKPKSQLKQAAQLRWWQSEIGYLTLSEVTPARLGEARDKLQRGRQPATVVRYMAALSHAFTIASNEWGWLEDNPLRKVRKPVEPRGRVRFLDEDERSRLLAACKQSECEALYPVAVLALSTGMRQGEILSLEWSQIDLARGYIYLTETKNGERRTVPLVSHAKQLITDLSKVRRIDTNLVFPSTIKPEAPIAIRRPWGDALKAAEIQDFRFHDLRHTAASYLAMNGASLAEIAEILGHKTLQMVKRYAHLSEQHTSRVLESMNRNMFS